MWIVLFTTIVLGVLLTLIYEKKIVYGRFKGKLIRLGKYHIHHSIVGLLLFLAALLFVRWDYDTTSTVLFGLGIGLIIQHTLSEKKLVFMSRKY